MRRSFLARLVAIVTTLFVLTAIVTAILVPLATWRDNELAKARDAVAARAELEASLNNLLAEKSAYVADDFSALVWQGSQTAQVSAKIQSDVNIIGQDAGVTMRSITPKPTDLIESAVGFRMEFEARLDQLSTLLRAIEYHQPALVVTGANLRRLVRPGEATLVPILFVQLDLAAPIQIQELSSR